MSEIYTGVKFRIKKLGNLEYSKDLEIQSRIVSEGLASLQKDWSTSSSGNVSIRTKKGFLISSTGTELYNLSYPNDFCEVVSSSQEKRIRFYGNRIPSSETRMHLLALENNTNENYCLHVHLSNIEKLQILDRFPVTSKFLSYGTIDLAREASNLLKSSDIVILRDHGIITMGNDFIVIIDEIKRISRL